ncbi:class I SAM-dependent methyltransferase [Aquabacterium sp.]|uniref:class I SAM-dependent methyltransferase n=1 Tax=Aquabacterium sp. TaxID=1872578 RepID=UPI002BD44FE4|nr:class I SAM-dependent methyltransferase [Aquabacterium sp.]HSW05527.1 class I SAM-dependent methyltransferase [Aquabacterium sp.]
MSDSLLARAAEHWSQPSTAPARSRWWQSRSVCRHINQRYCGTPAEGTHGGDIELLRKIAGGTRLERGISIGCGSGYHELKLLEADVVGHFTLYEISEKRAADALQSARAMGLQDRVSIQVKDAIAEAPGPACDLVYWKDALHHMLDARAAVFWSWQALKPGGIFFANEFVGPTHMQYTDRQLDLAEKVRRSLPEKYLVDPRQPSKRVPMRRTRPDLATFLSVDPTECADSSNILPAIRAFFPEAMVLPTGGVVYMLALNEILSNIHETEDAALLQVLMLADDLCIEAGETLYAVAHARR